MDAHPPRLFACSNKIGRFVVSLCRNGSQGASRPQGQEKGAPAWGQGGC